MTDYGALHDVTQTLWRLLWHCGAHLITAGMYLLALVFHLSLSSWKIAVAFACGYCRAQEAAPLLPGVLMWWSRFTWASEGEAGSRHWLDFTVV